jgi:hypothetical protein
MIGYLRVIPQGVAQNGRKIFASYSSDKGPTFRICRELKKTSTSKESTPQ